MKPQIDILRGMVGVLFLLVIWIYGALFVAFDRIQALERLAIIQTNNTHALIKTVGGQQTNFEALTSALGNPQKKGP